MNFEKADFSSKQKRLSIIMAGSMSYPQGYAGTQHVQAIVQALHSMGHDVKLVSWGSLSKGYPTSGVFEKIDYTMIPPLPRKHAFKDGIGVIKKYRSDALKNVMIVYGPPDIKSLHILLYARAKGFRIAHWIVEDYAAYDVLNPEQGAGRAKLLAQRFFSRIIKLFAHGVIILSAQLERKYVGQKVKTVLVPISTGRLGFKPRDKSEIQRNVIVYAGTLGRKDGVEDLIEAFEVVVKTHSGAQLKLVGSGARQAELEKKYGHISGVHFLGYLDDDSYEEMLSTAHVLCMTRVNTPYANGGFPYKVGDYVAMGRPVLATDVSDIRKYLIDRESAMIVESGSRQKMAEALDYLLRHPEEADRIGAKGRAVGEKYFNPDINAGLMADFCSTL